MLVPAVVAVTALAFLTATATAAAVPSNAHKVTIHPRGKCGKCLVPFAFDQFNHWSVHFVDCNLNDPASYWYIVDGYTYVYSNGPQAYKCMGGGAYGPHGFNPFDGQLNSLVDCFSPTWPAQSPVPASGSVQWQYDGGANFKLTGTNFCMDLKDGLVANNVIPQIWTCYANNNNQKWTVVKH